MHRHIAGDEFIIYDNPKKIEKWKKIISFNNDGSKNYQLILRKNNEMFIKVGDFPLRRNKVNKCYIKIENIADTGTKHIRKLKFL